jgi:hypothetical protein
VADFFGDGFPSVAVGQTGSNNVTLLRDNGDGTLEPPTIEVAPGNVTGLAAGDLGNGALDLVAANNSTGTVSVLLNDGTGNFTRTDYTLGGSPRNAFRVVLADVNGDGNLDMVTDNDASAGNPGFIYILYGNGDGTFQSPVIVNSGGNRPSGVAVADVEGDLARDGRRDIIVSNNASNNVTILVNTPAPVVVSTTLTGMFNSVDHGQIVFSDPIDPNTFTADQFVLVDPSGNPVNVLGIDGDSTNTRFNVTFDPQSSLGTYTLTLGPNIMDPTDTYTVPVFHSQFSITNELIVNGGFETGDFSGWTHTGDLSYTGVDSSVPVHSGIYAAYFGPTGGLGFISQSVNTTPGQSYALSLWLDHPYTGDTGTEYRVQIGGTTVDDQRDMGNMPYTQFTYTYTATSTTTVIQLGFLEPPAYFYVDDISFGGTGPRPAPHGGPGSANVLTSNPLSSNATALIQSPGPAPLSGSGMDSFSVQGQQQAVVIGAGGQAGLPINFGSSGVDNGGKFDPPTNASVARADTLAYHGLAASVLFSDPLLGDLFRDVI